MKGSYLNGSLNLFLGFFIESSFIPPNLAEAVVTTANPDRSSDMGNCELKVFENCCTHLGVEGVCSLLNNFSVDKKIHLHEGTKEQNKIGF